MLGFKPESDSPKRPLARYGPLSDRSFGEPCFKKPRTEASEFQIDPPPKASEDEKGLTLTPPIPQYGPGEVLKLDSAPPTTAINLPVSLKSSNSIRYGTTSWEHPDGSTVVFNDFKRKACIRNFDASILPSVSKKESYNDDIKLEHFQSSARHHAGKQRKGVADEHMECLSMLDHVDAAPFSPFFLSLSAPLPASILDAALFIRGSPSELVPNFWDAQLSALWNSFPNLVKLRRSGFL